MPANMKAKIFSFLMLAMILVTTSSSYLFAQKDVSESETSQKKTVLHIISANMEITREERFHDKLKEGFKDNESIEWYKLELSSKRFSKDSNRLAYFADILKQDCSSRNVSAIIVSGEDAFHFIRDYYHTLFRNVPVLLYGVDGSKEKEIKEFEPYFTGILEVLSAGETISAALDLFPNIKSLYVVNDDTTEGRSYQDRIREQLIPFADDLHIEYNERMDRDSLLAHMKNLPEDAMVLVGSYFLDANGQYFSNNEMKRAFMENCNVPIFTIYSTDLEYASIGGKCLDYEKNGELITDMLRALLNGVHVEHVPVVMDSSMYNRWVFNKELMDEWGIREASLPEGAEIINKKPSIMETNPEFAVSITVLFLISIGIIIGINVFFNQYRSQKEHLNNTRKLLSKEAKIKEVKERLESTINTSPVAYVLTVDGIVVEINDYMKQHVGMRVGDNVEQYYTDPTERRGWLDLTSKHRQILNNVVRFNTIHDGSHRFLSNFMEIEYEKKKAFVLWAMDIEESEKKNDQLFIAQQSLQTVMDTLPIAVLVIDVESACLTYANHVCLELFGRETFTKDGKGYPITEFMLSSRMDESVLEEKLSHIIYSVEPVTEEVVCRRADGTLFDALITAHIIDYKGRTSSLGIVKDLTAEKRYERQLIHVAKKEKEANQLKSSFLVNMSHEIRTPMNAIIGLTEIELRKNPVKETKEVYKKINSSAKNLLQIINDILDLSKIEANKMEIVMEEFELEDVLSNALLVVMPRLDEKDVELLLRTSPNLPRFLIGDKTRLWQILKNFLDNAAKYTDEGRIVLGVYVNEEASNEETAGLTFVVEDTGIGIEEGQLEKIFIPYEQFHNEAQKKYKGTGLGMAISKRLCEIMGGSLQVESKLGKGTTVRISIPFRRTQNQETQLQVVSNPVLKDKDILIVDDDEYSLDVVTSLFYGSDVACALACNGEEVMDKLKELKDGEDSFDVVLLDYKVDGCRAMDVARNIKAHMPETPILLLATSHQKQWMTGKLEDGVLEDVIEKPWIPSDLVERICEALGWEGEEEQETSFTQFRGVNILLCEDNLINQEVACGMLNQFGIQPVIAENGQVALDRLKDGQSYDLILMDLQMPVMDGYQATRSIRGELQMEDVPIISLTADAMTEVMSLCLEAGMNDHLTKPIEFDELHRVLLKWLPEDKIDSAKPNH